MENNEYIENFKVEDLKPYEKNAKMHSKDQVEKIKNSILEFGFINPIIIDENYEIIAGHGRLEAIQLARKLHGDTYTRRIEYELENGQKRIEELIVDLTSTKVLIVRGLTEDQKKAYRIADNKLTELGEWNTELLDQELKELKLSGFDVDLTGFEYDIKQSVDDITEDNFEEPEIDTIQTKIQLGDIYQIGNTKIACGSATDKKLIKKLIGTKKIACVFTDPPYGVSYKGTNNPNGKAWDIIEGDNLRGDELYKLIKETFEIIAEYGEEKIPLYVCYASKNHFQFEKGLNDAGFKVKQQIIWHKHHVLGHSDYHWTHEPILYCSRLENNCNYYGNRKEKTTIMESKLEDLQEKSKEELMEIIEKIKEQSDLWSIRKDAASSYVHPTQKPIKLPARAILNGSQENDLLYEPFGGSGSTIMAAIQTNREIVATELDPRYVQVILERIKAFNTELEIRCLTREITEEEILNP